MRLKYSFAIQEVADMFVAVAKEPTSDNPQKVFRLNETGAFIIERLQAGDDESAIVAGLTSTFNVDEETAAREVGAFTDMLCKNGLAE